jgi:hypothetical protein
MCPWPDVQVCMCVCGCADVQMSGCLSDQIRWHKYFRWNYLFIADANLSSSACFLPHVDLPISLSARCRFLLILVIIILLNYPKFSENRMKQFCELYFQFYTFQKCPISMEMLEHLLVLWLWKNYRCNLKLLGHQNESFLKAGQFLN